MRALTGTTATDHGALTDARRLVQHIKSGCGVPSRLVDQARQAQSLLQQRFDDQVVPETTCAARDRADRAAM